MKHLAIALLALGAVAHLPRAEAQDPARFPITIEPGFARESAIVEFALPAGAAALLPSDAAVNDAPARISLQTPAPASIPVQLERRGGAVVGHFALGAKSGDAMKGELLLGPERRLAKAEAKFSFSLSGTDHEDLLLGSERKIWRYMMTPHDPARDEETYKVYHHLFDFAGEAPITKGPGGKYTHHRGLYVGWNKTTAGGKTTDFWHMKPLGNVQRHAGFIESESLAGAVMARRAALVDWVTPEGKTVIQDVRTFSTYNQGKGRTTIDVDLKIESRAGDIRLDGDAQHAGLQFRAAQEVADNEKETVYVLPAGAARDKDDLAKAPWATAIFKVGGHRYAVMYMTHPSNRHRDSAVISARLYARFGEFFPTDLKAGEPLLMKYRIAVFDADALGEFTPARCQAIYEDYVKPVKVEVSVK